MNGKNHPSNNPLTVVGSSVGSGSLNFFPHKNHRFRFFQKKNQRFYERTSKKTHWFLDSGQTVATESCLKRNFF
jgi:hypothetical protein